MKETEYEQEASLLFVLIYLTVRSGGKPATPCFSVLFCVLHSLIPHWSAVAGNGFEGQLALNTPSLVKMSVCCIDYFNKLDVLQVRKLEVKPQPDMSDSQMNQSRALTRR